jgi:hypothetical protein
MSRYLTCKCCGETLEQDFRGQDLECWECGALVIDASHHAWVAAQAPKADPAEAAAKKAGEVFPVLVSKLATHDKFALHGMISATCRKHGSLFATVFTRLVLADERFAAIVGIMSPAQKDCRW